MIIDLILIKAKEIQKRFLRYLRLLAIITQAFKHSLIIYGAVN